jgi:hypothetical protein
MTRTRRLTLAAAAALFASASFAGPAGAIVDLPDDMFSSPDMPDLSGVELPGSGDDTGSDLVESVPVPELPGPDLVGQVPVPELPGPDIGTEIPGGFVPGGFVPEYPEPGDTPGDDPTPPADDEPEVDSEVDEPVRATPTFTG